MNATSHAPSAPDFETIRSLAYSLWEEAGRPPGQDIFFWSRAEMRLAAEKAPKQKAAPHRAAKTAAQAAPKRAPSPASNGQAKRPSKTVARKAAGRAKGSPLS